MDTHHLLECQGHLLHQSLKIIDICWDREKSLPCLSDGIDAPFSWHQTSDAIWLIILPDHSESEPPFPLHFHLQWLFSNWQKLWQQGLSAISSHWPTWFSKLYFTFYDPVQLKVSEFSGICPHWFLWYSGYAAGQDFVCLYLDKGWFLQWPPVNHCQRDSGWVAWVLADVESKELIVCFRSVSYNCIVLRKTIVRGICKQRIRHATFATILLFKNLHGLYLLVINFAKNNSASVSESLRSFDRHQ